MRLIGVVTCGALLACWGRPSQPGCEGAGAARAAGPWRLAIRVPDSVHRGDTVRLAVILQNAGDSALDPQLGLPGDLDFVVTRAGHGEVWSKRHGDQIVMGALRKGAIAAGDSLTIEHHWDQRGNNRQLVSRGVYCVRGSLSTEGRDSLETEVATLRVLP